MDQDSYELIRKTIKDRRKAIKDELHDLTQQAYHAQLLRLNYLLYKHLKRIKFGGLNVLKHSLEGTKILVRIILNYDIFDLEVGISADRILYVTDNKVLAKVTHFGMPGWKLPASQTLITESKIAPPQFGVKSCKHAARMFVRACRYHCLILKHGNYVIKKIGFGVFRVGDDVLRLVSIRTDNEIVLSVREFEPPHRATISINLKDGYVVCSRTILFTGRDIQDPDTKIIVAIDLSNDVFWCDNTLYYRGLKFKTPRKMNNKFGRLIADDLKRYSKDDLDQSNDIVKMDGNYITTYTSCRF